MKIFHVQGKTLKEMSSPCEFMNGDVYLVDNTGTSENTVYVWLGSKAYADDRGVGAWAARKLDLDDPSVTIKAEVEGDESDAFKKLVKYKVIEGDTPGFLKHVEINAVDVEYGLFRVYDADITDGSSSDDIVVEQKPIKKAELKSDDVFVLDGFQDLFVWIGKNSQVGEKVAGQRLARKFDVERKRTPMVYTIREGEEPPEFFELLDQLSKTSVKKRKEEDPAKSADKKKGFWQKIRGLFG